MRKNLLLLALAATVTAGLTGCKDYDDSYVIDTLNDHEQRISDLEEWQKTVNSNITSLQSVITALENNDCVTAYTELADGSGYTLTFKKGGTVTIKNGEDGHTPAISVKQGEDGNYYWTLDGEYLTGADGGKLAVTGNDGSDGSDGKDAIAPQVKIGNDNCWYISTDGGTTWTSTGVKATGNDGTDGTDGSDGSDGDSFFKDVYEDTQYNVIVFELTDGTKFLVQKEGIALAFEDGNGTFTVTPKNNKIKVIYTGITSTTDKKYNAVTAELSGGDETYKAIRTRATDDSPLTINKMKYDSKKDQVYSEITFNKTYLDNAATKIFKVTLIDSCAHEISISRVVKFLTENEATETDLVTDVNNGVGIVTASDGANGVLTRTSYVPVNGENSALTVEKDAKLTVVSNTYKSNVLNMQDEKAVLTITGDGEIETPKSTASISGAVYVTKGTVNISGNITIKNAVDAPSGTSEKDKKVNAPVVIINGTANITGGNFYSYNNEKDQANPCVFLKPNKDSDRAVLNISGGVFDSEKATNNYLINIQKECQSKCTVNITGGTFVGFDPSKDPGSDGIKVADGYEVKTIENYNSTGKTAYKVVKKDSSN